MGVLALVLAAAAAFEVVLAVVGLTSADSTSSSSGSTTNCAFSSFVLAIFLFLATVYSNVVNYG